MIKADAQAYHLNWIRMIRGFLTGHAFFAVVLYRIGSYLHKKKIKMIPDMILHHMRKVFACEISPYAVIGGGFRIQHTLGIVVGHQVVAGRNLELFQNVTIGSNRKPKNGREMPTIGDNVTIYTGAVVVGAIKIGDNAVIGANTYVDFDVPNNCFVHGKKGIIEGKV
ncbi:serine O-acetyltransferase [Eubacterium sp. ER2]|uniref:serine O-acetyltransferase n=1 Tax=Eubacterium sp. ER2 TaxID=1519438 RepID=UPI00068F4094|nr:serine acetyltransferase [Eubacterium sp. ER2]